MGNLGSAVAVPKFALARAPRTDDELWWAVQALWGIKIPRQRVCADHVSPFQAFADAYFARFPVTIWKASRGFGGKSYLLAVLSLTEAALIGAQISLLGGSGAQSLNVHEHSVECWAHFNSPKALLTTEPTKFDTHLRNKGHIRSLMASQTSVRGPHPQRLRLDEIDEMDLEILRAAQGQPMRKRGIETQTVMSSTHQYPDGTMSSIIEEGKEKGWPLQDWCWRETSNPIDGWLTREEVERKRAEISTNMWETEYDLQEPSFEGRSIDSEMVELAFSKALGEFTGDDPVCLEAPVPGTQYVTSIDWAKRRDWTIVGTFKVAEGNRFQCVAWQRYNKLPWQIMVKRAADQWLSYGGKLIHDVTGIGDVADDILREYVPSNMRRHIEPFTIPGGAARAALFSEYIGAIEQLNFIYPRIESAYMDHRYVRDDDLYKPSGHAPDSFIVGALAWSMRNQQVVVAPPVTHAKAVSWSVR